MKTKIPYPLIAFWLGSLGLAFSVGYLIRNAQTNSSEANASRITHQSNAATGNSDASAQDSERSEQEGAAIVTNEAESSDELHLTDIQSQFYAAMALPISDATRYNKLRDSLQKLAAVAPLEALALSAQIESIRDRERADRAILEIWAAHDPVAALAWAQEALKNETRHVQASKLQAIYRGYAQVNPAAAFTAASQLSTETRNASRMRERILEEIIETQIENGGLNAAKTTIEAMPEGADKENLMREMVDEWASYDPESAAAYVNSLGENASARLKSSLADEWAESNPEAAAAWLSTLPEGDPAIASAAAQVVREWARYDMYASAEWLNSLPASPELDRAVASYTFEAAQEDPATAMSWAESVSNDWMRTRLMSRVAAEWKDTDPAALEAYVNSSDLNDEQKKQLLEADQRGGGGRRRFGP